MKFNKGLLIVALVSINAICLGADVGRLGLQNNSIIQDDLMVIFEALQRTGNYNDDQNALAQSSMLRAQFSSDTTLEKVGDTGSFNRLFPQNQAAVIEQFRKLLRSDNSAERNDAMTQILALQSPAAAAAGAPVVVTTPTLANLRKKISSSRWDRSGDIDGNYNESGNYEIDRLNDNEFINWKSSVTDNCSPLILAAVLKDVDAVKELITLGANVNEANNGGTKALDVVRTDSSPEGTAIRNALMAAGAA